MGAISVGGRRAELGYAGVDLWWARFWETGEACGVGAVTETTGGALREFEGIGFVLMV